MQSRNGKGSGETTDKTSGLVGEYKVEERESRVVPIPLSGEIFMSPSLSPHILRSTLYSTSVRRYVRTVHAGLQVPKTSLFLQCFYAAVVIPVPIKRMAIS